MGQSWGLEANIMGVFADSNNLAVESVLYVEGVFREFKLIGNFVREHYNSLYSTAVCVRACYV